MTVTLTFTPGILIFFGAVLILTLAMLFRIMTQYRRKSQALDDIEKMTNMGLARIRDRRKKPRY